MGGVVAGCVGAGSSKRCFGMGSVAALRRVMRGLMGMIAAVPVRRVAVKHVHGATAGCLLVFAEDAAQMVGVGEGDVLLVAINSSPCGNFRIRRRVYSV